MTPDTIQLTNKTAEGYLIPLGPANLVFIKTDEGFVGCGAFNVVILEKFDYPAACVKAGDGGSIKGPDDILNGIIKEANAVAVARGIKVGMSGRDALELL